MKFKQITNAIQVLNFNFNSLIDYIKMEKMALAFDKIEKTHKIKTHFQNSIELLEDTHNKRYDNYKFIMLKIIFTITPS